MGAENKNHVALTKKTKAAMDKTGWDVIVGGGLMRYTSFD